MSTPSPKGQDNARAKYDALVELNAATEQDFAALSARFDEVQTRLEKTRQENEYLIHQLCGYAPSDFESDQSDLENDEELLAKKFALPRIAQDKASSSSAKANEARRRRSSGATTALDKAASLSAKAIALKRSTSSTKKISGA